MKTSVTIDRVKLTISGVEFEITVQEAKDFQKALNELFPQKQIVWPTNPNRDILPTPPIQPMRPYNPNNPTWPGISPIYCGIDNPDGLDRHDGSTCKTEQIKDYGSDPLDTLQEMSKHI